MMGDLIITKNADIKCTVSLFNLWQFLCHTNFWS